MKLEIKRVENTRLTICLFSATPDFCYLDS